MVLFTSFEIKFVKILAGQAFHHQGYNHFFTEKEVFKRSHTTVTLMPGGNKLYRFLTRDTKHFLSVVVIKIALSKRDMTQLSRISKSHKTARMVMYLRALYLVIKVRGNHQASRQFTNLTIDNNRIVAI